MSISEIKHLGEEKQNDKCEKDLSPVGLTFSTGGKPVRLHELRINYSSQFALVKSCKIICIGNIRVVPVCACLAKSWRRFYFSA